MGGGEYKPPPLTEEILVCDNGRGGMTAGRLDTQEYWGNTNWLGLKKRVVERKSMKLGGKRGENGSGRSLMRSYYDQNTLYKVIKALIK